MLHAPDAPGGESWPNAMRQRMVRGTGKRSCCMRWPYDTRGEQPVNLLLCHVAHGGLGLTHGRPVRAWGVAHGSRHGPAGRRAVVGHRLERADRRRAGELVRAHPVQYNEFLGDDVYAVATNVYGAGVRTDVCRAADCPAMSARQQASFDAGHRVFPAPCPVSGCPPAFGNNDLFDATTG
jgi:hypothetical protein